MSDIVRETEEEETSGKVPTKDRAQLYSFMTYLKQETGILYQSLFGYGSFLTVDLVSGRLL